jgi:hypothetical protein
MRTFETTIEKVEDEIVFALKKQVVSTPARQIQQEPTRPVRRAIEVENRDLEAAINDMLDRFPKTLEYLAK